MKKIIKDHLSVLNGIKKRALAIDRAIEKLNDVIQDTQSQLYDLCYDLELEADWFKTQIENENDKSNTTKPKKT